MPTMFLEIPDPAYTIRRASMISIVNNVALQLGLEIDYLQFTNYENNKAQTVVGEPSKVKVGGEDRIEVEVVEQRDNLNIVDRGLGFTFDVPILHDKKWGFRVTPATARYDVTTNLTARFNSRGKAAEWMNQMHRRAAMFGDVFETEATFYYAIPPQVISIAKLLHYTGAQRVAPTENIDDYLKKHFHPNVTIATTDTGSANCWTMRVTLGRVIVIMEGLGEIESDKSDDTDTFTCRISYKFRIDWPEAVKIDYPCTVNCTAIPECLWQLPELPGTVDISSYQRSELVYAQDKFTTHHEYTPLPIVAPPIGMPTFDTKHRAPTEREVFIAFLEFGEPFLDNPDNAKSLNALTDKHVCNLTDLGNVELTEATLAYIKNSYRDSEYGDHSLFKMYLYAYQTPMHRVVRIDQNLDVWISDFDIDLTEEYRLVLTLDMSTSGLTPTGRLALVNTVPWFIYYMQEFHQVLCLEFPWLFPGNIWNDNIAGGGLNPVFTANIGKDNPYWPTSPEWNTPGYVPKWPDDYFPWWGEDGIITKPPILNPDGSWDIEWNPEWPGWDWIIDEIGKSSKEFPLVTIHRSSIIALGEK